MPLECWTSSSNVSESLRSFRNWVGSVPVGFVLDNVSGFIGNAVGFGLGLWCLILVFPSVVGRSGKPEEFSRRI